jgi:hypothetical protein
MEAILKKKLNPPGIKAMNFSRELCLQRAFDNLISNEDRHQRNYLIMEDWRMILIDHSRSIRTTKKFTTKLIYDEKYREGPNFIMATVPRAFLDVLKALTPEIIRTAVGEYLTDEEIAATMARHDLAVPARQAHCRHRRSEGPLLRRIAQFLISAPSAHRRAASRRRS